MSVVVDGVEGESAAGHRDQCQGPGRSWRVALQPFVDRLVGDA